MKFINTLGSVFVSMLESLHTARQATALTRMGQWQQAQELYRN
jgi:hypothetical protein